MLQNSYVNTEDMEAERKFLAIQKAELERKYKKNKIILIVCVALLVLCFIGSGVFSRVEMPDRTYVAFNGENEEGTYAYVKVKYMVTISRHTKTDAHYCVYKDTNDESGTLYIDEKTYESATVQELIRRVNNPTTWEDAPVTFYGRVEKTPDEVYGHKFAVLGFGSELSVSDVSLNAKLEKGKVEHEAVGVFMGIGSTLMLVILVVLLKFLKLRKRLQNI